MKPGDLVKKVSGMDAGRLGLVVEKPSSHDVILSDGNKLVYVLIDHPNKKIRLWYKDKCEIVNEA